MSTRIVSSPDPPARQKEEPPPNLSPAERLGLLALSDGDTPEITQRRQFFREVERFFGLDVHREYMVATAVNQELRIVAGPTRVTWEHFEAWIAHTLTRKDAIVVEMTTKQSLALFAQSAGTFLDNIMRDLRHARGRRAGPG